MLAVIADGGMDRYDDLHVDRIDSDWTSKQFWFDGGLEAHQTAVCLRASHRLDVVVVLAFSLSESAAYPFSTRQEVEAAFDWSPPSLYLFRPGEEPWKRLGHARIEQFDPRLFSSGTNAISAFYAEFRQRDTGELCRSVYVAA